jgi:glycosyltransferase involved in cell wall biosynthesis
MQRICGSLARQGYEVWLVGRQHARSPRLDEQPYRQIRLRPAVQSGKRFYAHFNWLLFQYLTRELRPLNLAQTAICSIDLDTLPAGYFISKKLGVKRVYDAHELFVEMAEVKRRRLVHFIWNAMARFFIPRFPDGYTVNDWVAIEHERRYGVRYAVVRNMPGSTIIPSSPHFNAYIPPLPPSFILYQGAVNEGRAFPSLFRAMQKVDTPLVVAGEGNFFKQAKDLAGQLGLEKKVLFLGYVKPNSLRAITPKALLGLTLFENSGLNMYYSLANRFFDYVQAGIPQLCMDYPPYRQLNEQHKVAMLVADTEPSTLATALNKMLSDPVLLKNLGDQALQAARLWCWEKEEERLFSFWNRILPLG